MLRIAFAFSIIAATLSAADKKPSDLTLRDLSGKRVQLRDYRGKIVVLNFWATSCGPCREEMPMLVEAAKTWAEKGVAFIAISLDDAGTKKDIAAYLEAVFEDGDPALIAHALGVIARAEGMSEVAKQTGLTRASLYKALSADGHPEFVTVLKVVQALGLKMTVAG